MEHPFDRYSAFTDVESLKTASSRPLRKCIRVNTLKMRVGDFEQYAKEHEWKLEQIPWCNEGFFIDREDRSEPLGKDLLHLIGATYMQEASSMLPVTLLNPQPGERILDMSAAPGSKSTQIAALLHNSGVVVCNDTQDLRLKTLTGALSRSGVINAIVTKKNGQWFGENMTGRFDRVLIDAPCTGQGTARKDPTALTYCSPHSISKNASLQRELLESAIHATKIGGRIVYSTCTLTPEENEEVVMAMLKKFPDQLEVVDPTIIENGKWKIENAIKDSIAVQKTLREKFPFSIINFPFLRIWPQTYDTEGFFCAVLQKKAPTMHAEKRDRIRMKDDRLPKKKINDVKSHLQETYNTKFLQGHELLLQRDNRLRVITEEVDDLRSYLSHVSVGLPFGKLHTKQHVTLDHDIVTLRGASASENMLDISDDDWKTLLQGKDISCDEHLSGDVLLRYQDFCVGICRAHDGKLKNKLPRWMIYLHAS